MQKRSISGIILKWLKLLIFISFIVGVIFLLIQGVKAFKNSVWEKENTLSYVKIGEEIELYSFHPQEDKFFIVDFPEEILINTAKGFGEYKLKNIYALGEQEGIGGGKLLSYSLQNYLEGPIDGWILKKKGIKGFEVSNFTWWDRLRIFWKEKNVKFNQKERIDLESEGYLQKEELADGTEVWKFKENQKENLAIRIFGDSKVIPLKPQIKVLNATGKSKLGQHVAEMLRNIGFQVVTVKNNPEIMSKTSLVAFEEENNRYNYPRNKIRKIFSLNRVEERRGLEVEFILNIGLDYWSEYWGK